MTAQERLRSFVRLTKDIGFDHALQYNDLAADIELGQEWRLTEAALPEGLRLRIERNAAGTNNHVSTYGPSGGASTERYRSRRASEHQADGPTPAAALRALREKLK